MSARRASCPRSLQELVSRWQRHSPDDFVLESEPELGRSRANVIRAVLFAAALLVFSPIPHAAVQDNYVGHLFLYEKAETYTSLLDGKVHLLEPGGWDVIHDVSWALLIEGPISQETATNVQTLLERVPGIRTVFLNSPGGDLHAGLRLGRTLAAGDYQTVVTLGSECVSACALAFLGGKSRLILASPSSYGFHRQYYIKDGEIQYGSWDRDVAVIARYLSAVKFTGIRADEIVGTTGLATYSDNRLADRSIVTITRTQHQRLSESMLAATGISAHEQYAAACLLRAEQFDCGTVVLPFRAPLVLSYLREMPAALLSLDAMQDFRRYFRAVRTNKDLSALNCRTMRRDYIEWLTQRLEYFMSHSPPASIVDSYRSKIMREIDDCSELLTTKRQ